MITMIFARAKDNTIGHENGIPWRCPSDLLRFKNLTKGQILVMGRKTWESLPGKKLPGRTKFVLTRDRDYRVDHPEVRVYTDARDILHLSEHLNLFVIGGAEIYDLFLPFTDYIYESLINCEPDGDTKWAAHLNEPFSEIFAKIHNDPQIVIQDDKDEHSYVVNHYSRVQMLDPDYESVIIRSMRT